MSNQQVVEIQVPSEVRKEQSTKLVEVCWTRPIQVDAQDKDVPRRHMVSL